MRRLSTVEARTAVTPSQLDRIASAIDHNGNCACAVRKPAWKMSPAKELSARLGLATQRARETQHLNAYVKFSPPLTDEKLRSRKCLSQRERVGGLVFALKDNLCTQEFPTTCGSRFLADFASPFAATVVQNLVSQGAVCVGKTNMDEFAMGATSLHSFFGPVCNLHSSDDAVSNAFTVSGGSSGGSAVAVATKSCDFALGTDTGGSVRLPASFCGVVGVKPTYGRVSRFGLIPMANSMDCVGVMARDVCTSAAVLDAISGWDVKDSTCVRRKHLPCSPIDDSLSAEELLHGLRIGIASECVVDGLSDDCKSLWLMLADKLSNAGSSVIDISLPHFQHGVPCYTVLCATEVSSNLARYSGINFGYGSSGSSTDTADHMIAANRTVGLGPVVQHRILAGTFFLSLWGRDYYQQAVRLRQLIHRDFRQAFLSPQGVDAILTPVSLGPAPTRLHVEGLGPVRSSMYDWYTVPINLAGVPAISIPVGNSRSGLPIGMQLIGSWFDERRLIQVGRAVEMLLTSMQ